MNDADRWERLRLFDAWTSDADVEILIEEQIDRALDVLHHAVAQRFPEATAYEICEFAHPVAVHMADRIRRDYARARADLDASMRGHSPTTLH